MILSEQEKRLLKKEALKRKRKKRGRGVFIPQCPVRAELRKGVKIFAKNEDGNFVRIM